MSRLEFSLTSSGVLTGVQLDVNWPQCEDGDEDDMLQFTYFGDIPAVSNASGVAEHYIRKRFERHGPRKKDVPVDRDGNQARVQYRRGNRARVVVLKPLERALTCAGLRVAKLLERFKRGAAESP